MRLERRARLGAMVLGMFVLSLSASAIAALADGLDALRKGDFAAAAKELKPLAEQGNAEAQYRVGLMYEFGKGFPADKAEAIRWFRRSAAQDHAAAQLELGILHATGDGVPQDDAQAVDWFRNAARQGNATAQYNLGLMYAKGAGLPRDDAQAIAWFRKAADQGLPVAQFKLGVAYENGEGVARDDVVAFADHSIAARNGDKQAAAHRDAIGAKLTPAQLGEGQALAAAWEPGKPMPTRAAAAAAGGGRGAAADARRTDTCMATGTLEGERFAAGHCAVSLYGDRRSVAIWFNEDAISDDEATGFQLSSYADGTKSGKPRTMIVVMFCPGGGADVASAGAVRSLDVNTNHARAARAGLQRVLDAPSDFKVERLGGDIRPGGRLSGRIVATVAKTTLDLEFDLALPAKEAAAGYVCSG